jgi:hypothetical protein
MIGLLMAALMARGLRPKEATDTKSPIPGVATKRLTGGSKRAAWRKTIAKLRAMPDYKSKAERNRAKAKRRALRAAGVVAS